MTISALFIKCHAKDANVANPHILKHFISHFADINGCGVASAQR